MPRHRLYRLRAAIRRVACQHRGRHTPAGGDWGYGMNGLVDRFCANCHQFVDRIPLDDFERNRQVLAAIDLARSE